MDKKGQNFEVQISQHAPLRLYSVIHKIQCLLYRQPREEKKPTLQISATRIACACVWAEETANNGWMVPVATYTYALNGPGDKNEIFRFQNLLHFARSRRLKSLNRLLLKYVRGWMFT